MSKQKKSTTTHAILDPASRKRKAYKIAQVLQSHTDLGKAKLLDVGTGSGYIAHHLGQKAGEVHSVDVADERQIKTGYTYKQVADERLPFADNSFDVIVSNHIIEHVPNQQLHIDEALRVLRPGGVMYLATPNRYWLIDPHYKAPFINWMPRWVAGRYLRTLKGAEWDINPTTMHRIRKYAGKQHAAHPVIASILKNPEQYNLDMLRPLHPLLKCTPMPVLKHASQLSPTIIMVIKKSSD